jgi:hypothetical protein
VLFVGSVCLASGLRILLFKSLAHGIDCWIRDFVCHNAERSLHELKQANQSAPQATNSPTESIQQNTRVKQLEAELVAKQVYLQNIV